MAKLPKSLIKKYGISKKAWAVFRGSKRTTSSKKKNSGSKRYYTMARHKKHYRKSGKGFFSGSAVKVVVGAGLAAVYEVFVSPMIPLSDMIKNILELAVGLFLAASKRMPMPVRAFGGALATINAYSLIMPYVSGAKGSSSVGSAWG